MKALVRFQRILGVRFIVADVQDVTERACRLGGLIVMPSGPALLLLRDDRAYREAVLRADLALPDSSLMVLLWNFAARDHIRKLSGLKYLSTLLQAPDFRQPHSSFWVMPSAAAAQRNAMWLKQNGVGLRADDVYLAPIYAEEVRDAELLRLMEMRRPRHIVMALAGGTQEKLGLYLKHNLSYKPAIHCIGAAIAFLSGDQVRIPVWVDRAGLGWLWRTASNPAAYVPRYWVALKLIPTLLHYGHRLPLPGADALPLPAGLPSAPFEQ